MHMCYVFYMELCALILTNQMQPWKHIFMLLFYIYGLEVFSYFFPPRNYDFIDAALV